MTGDLIQSFPAPPDLPHRGRGTARRRWKEFVTITGLRGIATIRCICICELHCCRLGNGESSSADDGTRSARPRGLGGDFEFLPLKSPRNPITPIETSRVATLHSGLYTRFREDAECRRARDARPYNVAENCNCKMRLQRWVASLQRLDAFTTVGCTAGHRRGAHCAPVYLRCYNNLSSERAKGYRGDRKAPISNRRQGRRP